MITLFPTWPFILFGIIEPLSTIGGFLGPIIDVDGFIAGQTSLAHPPPLPHHPSTLALGYQLGNIYLLVGLLAVGVIYGTSERHVLRNMVAALAVADVGHLCATYAAMGRESFLDVASWSTVAWGNIAFTAFLLVNRLAYLVGVFETGVTAADKKKPKKKKKRA